MLVLVAPSCADVPTEVSGREQREITFTVVSEFLKRLNPDDFAVIYLSDEFLQFSIDSAFIAKFSSRTGSLQIGRRDEVAVSYDIMPEGTLLLEPCAPRLSGWTAVQCLSFAATSSYGGQYRYELHRDALGRWVV